MINKELQQKIIESKNNIIVKSIQKFVFFLQNIGQRDDCIYKRSVVVPLGDENNIKNNKKSTNIEKDCYVASI